jgi:hypothetical protein
LNWKAARDEIGLQALVVIDEFAKVTDIMARDEISLQVTRTKGKSRRLPLLGRRDEMDRNRVPP